ncbi:MAG: aminotransferase [Solirubrobacteraceae bacterium]|nr:aminotransferase [Solirubrobacteraceae bacterium]
MSVLGHAELVGSWEAVSDGVLILPDETHAPRFTATTAEELAAQRWGLTGATATELGSYQDQVFQIDTPDGERFALKFANTEVGRPVLEAEHLVLDALGGALGPLATPRVVATTGGDEIIEVGDHLARVLTWVPGTPLAVAGFVDHARARALGDAAGRISAALASIDHPGAHRTFQWDVRQAGRVADLAREQLDDDEWAMQQRALSWLSGVDDASLPRQIAYTDVTANNLLGHLAPDGTFTSTALVDFGDAVYTWRLADAVGAAYSAVAGDPALALELALTALTAFHAHQPLSEVEADAFWPVLAGRAALCAASSAKQVRGTDTASEVAGAYLEAFLARDDAALRAILAVDPVVARAAARAACGLAPCPTHRSGPERLAALKPGPLLEGIEPGDLVPVDLGMASPLLTEGAWDSPTAIGAALREWARGHDSRSTILVGRWGEVRLVGAGLPSAEPPAALHLGADLFAPAGSNVLAPFAAHVITAAGGIVELESTTAVRAPVLRLAGVEPVVKAGDEIAAGARLGTVRRADAADPLPPHLHVQLGVAPGMPPGGDPALADTWLALCPDPSGLLGADVAAPPQPSAAEQRARRDRSVARPQHLYYREPAQIVRGWRQYLYDADGRPYLDMVNNVASIGHAHPAVTEAATRQFQLLNTNSRFLYDAMADYAEAITATLPAHLDTVFFVNSGSEAVDLAVRIARTATGRNDLLAVEGAYHGWTGSVFEFCTHPQDNPNWRDTMPAWIHPVAQPNPYRSPRDPEGRPLGTDAAPYLASVRAQCEAAAANGGVAAFVAEPLLGNQGAIAPPPGYLAGAYEIVREHGGICVADEIQVGYGRSGETFWAFEYEGVEPDILTAAKAVGNGHPLGFVACRRELAEQFGAHASWFSSPGGGAVSCRVGEAVLATIQGEGLQRNAALVGAHLKAGIEALAQDHPIIGRVNGRGLYMGVDLVRDRTTLEPADGEARAICERLRRYGVILQPTGDHANVLKVKPPLCLTEADADFVVAALRRVLDERASSL